MSPILYFITLNLKKGGGVTFTYSQVESINLSCCGFKSTHNIENNLRKKNKPEKTLNSTFVLRIISYIFIYYSDFF